MSDRKRRLEIAKSLKDLLLSKGKTPSVKYQQTFEELKEASDMVSFAPFFEILSKRSIRYDKCDKSIVTNCIQIAINEMHTQLSLH